MTRLIFGCGYLGLRVARLWRQAGQTVHAVTRRADRAEELAAAGVLPIIADVLQPHRLPALPPVHTVLFAVGFDRAAGVSIQRLYVEGLANVLAAMPPDVKRVVYISSTGVYAQADGSWVDEQSPCHPARSGGLACLEAERLLQHSAAGGAAVILRMAGIYGPGRIPRRKELHAGQPLAAPSEGYLNLIHVDDAARAVAVAEAQTAAPALYCVSDSQPVRRRDYYSQLANLIGAPTPTFVPPPEGSPALERAGSSKRVSSRLFRNRFTFPLDYPSYREGLAAIIAEEQAAARAAERQPPP